MSNVQAALAARELGESVLDGSLAIKHGLAKRGVVHTYVMLEGCPKQSGCAVILCGALRSSIETIKGCILFPCKYCIQFTSGNKLFERTMRTHTTRFSDFAQTFMQFIDVSRFW